MTKLNLQMFANMNTQTTLLGTANSNPAEWGGTGLSAEMKTFYDMTLIDEAQANLVHDQFGQKRNIPANGGKKIEFRKFAALPKATTPLTEGVTPDGNSLDVSTIEATVKQYGDYIVQSDVLELTSIDNTIVEATKLLGRQAGLTLDTVVREYLNAGTNVSYAPKVVDGVETEVASRANLDATCKLTVDLVYKMMTKLRAVNAPTISGDYVCLLHPYVAHDLMRDEEWIEAHKYATPENIYKGEIGKIGNVRFVQSSEAKIFRGTDDNCPDGLAVFSCLFMGADAYGVTEIEGGGLETIVKQKGSAGTADPLDQRSSVGWKGMRTAEILIPAYLIRCEVCSSYSATAQAN